MSKSASLPKQRFDTEATESSTAAWKQEVNDRLAAHRTRRGDAAGSTENQAAESPRTASSRAAEAAARVAARYAKAPSYSQLLAGEARAVVRAAGAAAEAALAAEAAAQAVLAGLESGMQRAPEHRGYWEPEVAAPVAAQTQIAPAAAPGFEPAFEPIVSRWQDEPPVAAAPAVAAPSQWAGAQARWEEALPVISAPPAAGRDVWSDMRVHPNVVPEADYQHHYDESELFSHDPVGHATVEPVQHLPANLIEFPRELTATRKARPRLAEGPLYDAAAEDGAQLSIFEVDPELLAPPIAMTATEVAPPEWASITLDRAPSYSYAETEAVEHHAYADTSHLESQYAYAQEAAAVAERALATPEVVPVYAAPEMAASPEAVPADPHVVRESRVTQAAATEETAELLVARVSDRMLAAVVDGALVMLAFLAAAVVVIASTDHPPTGKLALIASGFGLVLFYLLYQYLFLSYAEEGTPGMRYARIALCTFCDENPTRQQMQMRIPAMVLATVPAGLGLVWALFDGDKLGWHDRLTKTYQRKY